MSAWLCGNKTLSLCVDVIKSDEFKEKYCTGYEDEDAFEILKELAYLNTLSLNSRYGNRGGHILVDKQYLPLEVDDGQKYKSVCCYLYQTCECQDNYNHPLFKALNDWSNENEKKYEKEWDKYSWDIDNSTV